MDLNRIGYYFIYYNILLVLMLLSQACDNKDKDGVDPPNEAFVFRAADLSHLPEIEEAGVVFYNRIGEPEDMLSTLKKAGLNTVRIRLWHNPADGRSGFQEVSSFSEKVRSKGLKVWLTVHYSDTWADPGHQAVPEMWKNLGLSELSDSIYQYTTRIITQIKPDFIQIGNEINGGILWPVGRSSNMVNFKELLRSGVKAVRDQDKNCKIMMHYAGINGSEYLLSNLQSIDYDIVGISYYPFWHGKDLAKLESDLIALSKTLIKPIVIAETSYPFTLGWNDWTNNVIGETGQILPDYAASEEGQAAFMNEMKRISTSSAQLIGFSYWGGEWVAFKGQQATNGSSWENQAFYDFSFRALPVIEVFSE
ncbi:MAG: arabinogalactan endo-1,4-beta-galactosidase [Lentimicrobium sp.]|nr:arabinogalactan endo-1,4-beta-galactosidase [Lentimicrobium sp.]